MNASGATDSMAALVLMDGAALAGGAGGCADAPHGVQICFSLCSLLVHILNKQWAQLKMYASTMLQLCAVLGPPCTNSGKSTVNDGTAPPAVCTGYSRMPFSLINTVTKQHEAAWMRLRCYWVVCWGRG